MKTSTQLKALIRNLSRDKGINAEIIEGGIQWTLVFMKNY